VNSIYPNIGGANSDYTYSSLGSLISLIIGYSISDIDVLNFQKAYKTQRVILYQYNIDGHT